MAKAQVWYGADALGRMGALGRVEDDFTYSMVVEIDVDERFGDFECCERVWLGMQRGVGVAAVVIDTLDVRSMCVGDVVTIGSRAYVADLAGFKPCTFPTVGADFYEREVLTSFPVG